MNSVLFGYTNDVQRVAAWRMNPPPTAICIDKILVSFSSEDSDF